MASKTSPTKALARVRTTLKNQREKSQKLQAQLLNKGIMVASSAAIAVAEDQVPVDFGGVPSKLIGAGLMYAIAAFTKGGVSGAAEAVGDALANVYTYKVAMQVRSDKASPHIAGEPYTIDYIPEP